MVETRHCRDDALRRLRAMAGVRRAFVAERDGLPVDADASRAPTGDPTAADVAGELDCALVAALCGAAARALEGLRIGRPVETIIQTESNALYVVLAGELIAGAVAERGANAAEVRLALRQVLGAWRAAGQR